MIMWNCRCVTFTPKKATNRSRMIYHIGTYQHRTISPPLPPPSHHRNPTSDDERDMCEGSRDSCKDELAVNMVIHTSVAEHTYSSESTNRCFAVHDLSSGEWCYINLELECNLMFQWWSLYSHDVSLNSKVDEQVWFGLFLTSRCWTELQ